MGWLEDALLLLVHGGSVRHGFSSVERDHVNLESSSLECGGKDLLKNIPSTEKHVIIETACAEL